MPQTPKPAAKVAGAQPPKAKLTLEQSRALRAAKTAANKAANAKTRPPAPNPPRSKKGDPKLPGTNQIAADPLVDPKYTPLTPIVIDSFLHALGLTGNLTEVCDHLRLSRISLLELRRQDPELRDRWARAMEHAAEGWEAEVARRAFQGVQEPVYQGGVLVGHVRKYSDRLAEMMLRGYKTEQYKPAPQQVNSSVQGTMTNVNLTATMTPEQVDEELKTRQAMLDALDQGRGDYSKAVGR